MSKFDVKNNKSICVLPWIHEFKSVGGHTAPCCVAKSLKNKTNNGHIKNMKHRLDGKTIAANQRR